MCWKIPERFPFSLSFASHLLLARECGVFIASASTKGTPLVPQPGLPSVGAFLGLGMNWSAIPRQCLFLAVHEESRNKHFPTPPPLIPNATSAFCCSLIISGTRSFSESKTSILRPRKSPQRVAGALPGQRREDTLWICRHLQTKVIAQLLCFQMKEQQHMHCKHLKISQNTFHSISNFDNNYKGKWRLGFKQGKMFTPKLAFNSDGKKTSDCPWLIQKLKKLRGLFLSDL